MMINIRGLILTILTTPFVSRLLHSPQPFCKPIQIEAATEKSIGKCDSLDSGGGDIGGHEWWVRLDGGFSLVMLPPPVRMLE